MDIQRALRIPLLLLLAGCETCVQPFDHTEEESLSVALTGLGEDCAGEGEEITDTYASSWVYEQSGETCEIRVTFAGPLFTPGPTIDREIEEAVAESGEWVQDVDLYFQDAAFEGKNLRLTRGGQDLAVPAERVDIVLVHEEVDPLLTIQGQALASLGEAQMAGVELGTQRGADLSAVFQDLWVSGDAFAVAGEVLLRVPMSALPALSEQELAVDLGYSWTVAGEAEICWLPWAGE